MAIGDKSIEIVKGATLELPFRLSNADGLLEYDRVELRAQVRQRPDSGRAALSFSTEDDSITLNDGATYPTAGDPEVELEASFVLHASAAATAAVKIDLGWIDVEAVHNDGEVEKIVGLSRVRIVGEATR